MKRLLVAILCTLTLTACGSGESNSTTSNDKPVAKETKTANSTKQEKNYIRYDNATWSGEFNGLKINVEGVVVSNDIAKALEMENAEPNTRGIFVHIITDNTTDREFLSTLSTTKLVTSSREQAEPDAFLSDNFPLEIAANAKTDGILSFVLRTKDDVKNIRDITLYFEFTDQKTMETKKFTVNLPLK